MLSKNEKITNYVRGLVEKLGYLINPFVLNHRNENNQLIVFYFHGLYESLGQKDLNHIDPQTNMTVSQFDEFIDYFLGNDYVFLKPEDLLAGLEKDKRYAMITFDDGYYNNLFAIDTLNKYKTPAVFFVTVKNMLDNKSYWWDIVYKHRSKQGYSKYKIKTEQELLKDFKHAYIEEYIKSNFGRDSFKPWSDIDRPMTEMEVKSLVKSPYSTIGNHTYNHSILINCSKSEIKEEFLESNKILSDLTGTSPIVVAFPNGSYNKMALDVAEEIGFRIAFNAKPKKNQLPIETRNLICLSRFMANTNNIKNYGSFYRLGYTPGSLYKKWRNIVTPFSKEL